MASTYERPRERDVGLAPWAERAVRAVAEAVFARSGAGGELEAPPAERIAWLCTELDDFLARISAPSRALVLLSLFAVSAVAPLFVRRLGSLASLPRVERVVALEHFERSMFAPALLAVKALASVHYYEHPDAAREVGFDGACLVEDR